MRRLFTSYTLLAMAVLAFAQPQQNYYRASTLDDKNGRDLELALKEIVGPHTHISYDDLWTYFPTTDPGPIDSIPATYTGGKTDLVYDMYAWMKQFPKFYSGNDHSQTGGFNREHGVPNSWWGGKSGNSDAYSDLHHLMPADGAANNAKGNYPLGEYENGFELVWPIHDGYSYYIHDTNTHTEGELGVICIGPTRPASHVWKNAANKYFYEPTDEYKGDFARMYLYVVCAYEGDLTWQTAENTMFSNGSNNYTVIADWAKDLLLKWHRQDPVSDKERARNNAVESIQHNRNPFIDYPELAEYIWGNKSSQSFSLANAVSAYSNEYINGGNTGETPEQPGGETAEKQPASITFVLHTRVGQPFHGFTYNSDSDGTATYTSSNTAVAEVNAQTGEVTIKAAGEVMITYSITETERFNAAQDQYKIVVTQ